MVSKNPYLIKLATSMSFDIPEIIITKEKVMNYYIHQYQKNSWDEFTVNDVVKAALMAGKRVKGNSLLEINVSLKEQLEFYSQDMRLYNGRGKRFDASNILEKNKGFIITCYLNNVSMKEIAEKFCCSECTLRRWLTKKGIRKKGTRQKSLTWERNNIDTSKISTEQHRGRIKVTGIV